MIKDATELTDEHRILLLAIRLTDLFFPFPASSQIAKQTGLGRKRVDSLLRKMEREGLIMHEDHKLRGRRIIRKVTDAGKQEVAGIELNDL